MLAGTPALIRFFRLKEVFVLIREQNFSKGQIFGPLVRFALPILLALFRSDVRRGGHDGRRPVCHRRGCFRRFHRKLLMHLVTSLVVGIAVAQRAARAKLGRRQRGGIREDHRRDSSRCCDPRRSAHRREGVLAVPLETVMQTRPKPWMQRWITCASAPQGRSSSCL